MSGHASHPRVLARAGCEDADLLIAVTNSDEVNIVACEVARTLFRTPTRLARVRSGEYLAYPQLFGDGHLAVDVFISPELLVCRYIERLVQQPMNVGVRNQRGFTGHEHLDEFELIHMNGRLYDYNLGRFYGVDPFVQFPANSQSLNPYSYLMNNPLAGTDPTGYLIFIPFAIKAVGTGLSLWGAWETGTSIGNGINDIANGELSVQDAATNVLIEVAADRAGGRALNMVPDSIKKGVAGRVDKLLGGNGADRATSTGAPSRAESAESIGEEPKRVITVGEQAEMALEAADSHAMNLVEAGAKTGAAGARVYPDGTVHRGASLKAAEQAGVNRAVPSDPSKRHQDGCTGYSSTCVENDLQHQGDQAKLDSRGAVDVVVTINTENNPKIAPHGALKEACSTCKEGHQRNGVVDGVKGLKENK